MTRMVTLQVRKDDLSRSRIAESEAPALQDGQLLAQGRLFAFGLSERVSRLS